MHIFVSLNNIIPWHSELKEILAINIQYIKMSTYF